MNAVEIEEAISKLVDSPFNATEFPFAFLEAFGNKEATIKRLRAGATNQSDVPGAVLQLLDHFLRQMSFPAHRLDPPDPGRRLKLRLDCVQGERSPPCSFRCSPVECGAVLGVE
jgi:hypothetical protein